MSIAYNEYIFKAKQLKLIAADGQQATEQQKQFLERFNMWHAAAQQKIVYDSRSAAAKLLEDWKDATKQMKDASGNWLTGFTDALTDFVVTGKLSFRSLAESIIRDLVRIQIQAAITSAVSSLGSIFGGASSVPGAAGSTAGSITGFADGGDPPVGRASLVGERGPELFVPKVAGTIVPNERLSGLGGNTYYIDARGADVAAVARLERTVVELAGPGRVEQRAMAAMANSSMRGGRYSAALS